MRASPSRRRAGSPARRRRRRRSADRRPRARLPDPAPTRRRSSARRRRARRSTTTKSLPSPSTLVNGSMATSINPPCAGAAGAARRRLRRAALRRAPAGVAGAAGFVGRSFGPDGRPASSWRAAAGFSPSVAAVLSAVVALPSGFVARASSTRACAGARRRAWPRAPPAQPAPRRAAWWSRPRRRRRARLLRALARLLELFLQLGGALVVDLLLDRLLLGQPLQPLRVLLARVVRQPERRDEEDRRGDRRQPREEVAGARRSEDRLAAAAAAERDAHAAALTGLQQHDQDQEQTDQDVKDREKRDHETTFGCALFAADAMRDERLGADERRAARQPTVDVRLGHERADVVRLHAAAVENAKRRRDAPPSAWPMRPRMKRCTSSRLRRRRGAPRADGPHRLVGDQAAREVGVGDVRDGGVELGLDAPERLARVALGERLADADDGREPGAQRRARLEVHGGVELAEELAPLGVAEDDVLAADVGELGRRDLAREGALVLPEAVLGRDGDRAALQPPRDRVQRRGSSARRPRRRRAGWRRRYAPAVASSTDSAIVAVQLPVAAEEGAALILVVSHDVVLQLSSAARPGQLLALEQLERGAAARRDVGDLVGDAALVHGRDRVAAAHDRQRLGRGDRLGDRQGSARERLRLEDAHRSVPEDRLGARDGVGEAARRLGADVERREILGDRHRRARPAPTRT